MIFERPASGSAGVEGVGAGSGLVCVSVVVVEEGVGVAGEPITWMGSRSLVMCKGIVCAE